MTQPNFFIVGAPKCGTTSLANWLGQHPNVYMSPQKEPHYYSSDLVFSREYTRDSYDKLFDDVAINHYAVGEASASYLRSEVAVKNISHEIPDARYIVMLRNPLEMAPSLHWQTVFAGDENILDFEKAWALQAKRERLSNIPRGCRDPQLVQYRLACKLGTQLEHLYSYVYKNQVLVIFLEDIQRDPRVEWHRVLKFLDLPFWISLEFTPKNKSKQWKFQGINRFRRVYQKTQERLGIPPFRLGLFTLLTSISTKEAPRKPLSSGIRRELVETFGADVRLLSELTGRDLSHWVNI